MPTEISTINSTANLGSQVRQAAPVPVTERQATVTSGQSLPPAEAQQASQQASGTVQQSEIDRAISDINSYVQKVSRELQFSLEEELPLGRAVIRVVDSETEEVIREIPSKEVLQVAQRLNELSDSLSSKSGIKGLIIQAQA